jgi:hypothetical protein
VTSTANKVFIAYDHSQAKTEMMPIYWNQMMAALVGVQPNGYHIQLRQTTPLR